MIHRLDSSTDKIVDELTTLLKPSWGAEKWILEGWNKITVHEKELIKERMHDLFKDGLPFEIQHDKLLYIYTFSLLAQLEVLAIQVPLRFEEKMSTPLFKQQMRTQLLDEIFHGMVFTKIVYLLCEPYHSPPAYNEYIEGLCDFIRNEDCPKVGVVLLNLVAEGWIEEIFKSLYKQNIAPRVFDVILEDEHRHVCEADLYQEIGIPDRELLSKKLETLEGLLLNSLSLQPKYASAVSVLLGAPATHSFILTLNEKHIKQLKKIKLVPSRQWQLLMQMGLEIFSRLEPYTDKIYKEIHEVEMTPIRKAFMTQWNAPGDPTMVCQFNMDISCLDFFGKKYPAETLTTLMMQALSQQLTTVDSFRNFLSYKKMYQSRSAFVAVVVKLPGCGDHVGNIIFKDCHEITVQVLAARIRHVLQMMVYCYMRREQIEKDHPHVKHNLDKVYYDAAHDAYAYPVSGSPVVSISSIGFCGYSQAVSPLRKTESLKLTLLTVERKPVWSNTTQSFEAKDMLPVSISADHRIFDGNLPIPKLLDGSFQIAFQKMLQDIGKPVAAEKPNQQANFAKIVDKMLAENLELGYRVLATLQNVWPNFVDIDDIVNEVSKKMANTRLAGLMRS
jgi:hypothetical protein